MDRHRSIVPVKQGRNFGTNYQIGRLEPGAAFDACELVPLWHLGQDAVKLGYLSFQPW